MASSVPQWHTDHHQHCLSLEYIQTGKHNSIVANRSRLALPQYLRHCHSGQDNRAIQIRVVPQPWRRWERCQWQQGPWLLLLLSPKSSPWGRAAYSDITHCCLHTPKLSPWGRAAYSDITHCCLHTPKSSPWGQAAYSDITHCCLHTHHLYKPRMHTLADKYTPPQINSPHTHTFRCTPHPHPNTDESTHTHTHLHTHMHAHTPTHTHTYIHTLTHTLSLTHSLIHKHTHTHTHACTHTHTHTHHAHTHTYTRTHTHTHTCTHWHISNKHRHTAYPSFSWAVRDKAIMAVAYDITAPAPSSNDSSSGAGNSNWNAGTQHSAHHLLIWGSEIHCMQCTNTHTHTKPTHIWG